MTTVADQPIPAEGKRTAWVVWAILVASTALAWLLTPGHLGSTTHLSSELVPVIVALGMIKCRLIIRYFMEVSDAPGWLRIATDVWLAVLWLTLLGIYLYR
jgi:hypothetical protein